MDFDKSLVYTAANAGDLRQGDKVIVADTMQGLAYKVRANEGVFELAGTRGWAEEKPFVLCDETEWLLAYLVEFKENCTNCANRCSCPLQKPKKPELSKCSLYRPYKCKSYKPKTEPIGTHYRQYKDTQELIECWYKKKFPSCPSFIISSGELTKPSIWLRRKGTPGNEAAISGYGGNKQSVFIINNWYTMADLFDKFTFFDGSPLGVEVKE